MKRKTHVLFAALAAALFLCSAATAGAQGRYGGSTMRSGERSADVRALQEDLAALGYYGGNVTGHYGNLTREAVRQFQRKNGLTVDGVAGPRTQEKLEGLIAGGTQGAGGQDAGADGTAPVATTLRLDAYGEEVRALQENLQALKYFKGNATGHYGRLTKEAVRLFQKDNSLTADGIAGPRTLAKIYEVIACKSEPAALSAPAAPQTDGAQAEGAGEQDPALLDTANTLRYGKRSEEVRKLQDALRTLGHFTRTSTGYYGLNTTQAVQAYQRAKGLAQDGVAGRATLKALNGDLAAVAAAKSTSVAAVTAFIPNGEPID